MKKIQHKIALSIVCMALALCIPLVTISSILCGNAVMDRTNADLLELADSANKYIVSQITQYTYVAQEIGRNSELSDPDTSLSAKEEILNECQEAYGLSDYDLIDKDGISLRTGEDASALPFFEPAMNGETYFSEPVVSEVTGNIVIAIGAPLMQNGSPAGCVLVIPDPDFLNNTVAAIDAGETGSVVLINKDGTVIAAKDASRVNNENSIALAEADSSYADLAELTSKAVSGEEGYGTYSFQGITKIAAYHPIENGSGWSVFITAEQSEYTHSIIISDIVMISVAAALLLIGALCANFLGKRISKPVVLCANRLKSLGGGDLQSPVPAVRSKDETKLLADTTETLVYSLKSMIGDVDYVLSTMSDGNFDVHCQAGEYYVGDFAGLRRSMSKLGRSLSATLCQIDAAAAQVSLGSEQLASGATSLSQGATEQASSIEELAATITEMSNQISNNAENAGKASRSAAALGSDLKESNRQMEELVAAMADINDASGEISKVIKAIEDIAFQTNILALNAAVEAARAGTAGKGFAVVAEEVRSLAQKSASAANSTTELIKRTVQAVQAGTSLVDTTSKTLSDVAHRSIEMVATMDDISIASQQQAEASTQITAGIDQISGVVQMNSSAAEESAATSQELSAQSQLLKDLVNSFTLRQE